MASKELENWEQTVKTQEMGGPYALQTQALAKLFDDFPRQLTQQVINGEPCQVVPTFPIRYQVGKGDKHQQGLTGTVFFSRPRTEGKDKIYFNFTPDIKDDTNEINQWLVDTVEGIITNIKDPGKSFEDFGKKSFLGYIIEAGRESLTTKKGRPARAVQSLAATALCIVAAGGIFSSVNLAVGEMVDDLAGAQNALDDAGYQNGLSAQPSSVNHFMVALNGCGPFDAVKYNFPKLGVYVCESVNLSSYTIHPLPGSHPHPDPNQNY